MRRRAANFVLLIVVLTAISCSDRDTGDGTLASEAAMTPPRARETVVLVHGWLGSPRDFSAMKTFLDARGFHSFIAILPGEDNIANARYLRDLVVEVEELTGVEKVDVVGYSMGGLSLRYYIRFLGGDAEVKRYVSIDTPQYGDPSACALPTDLGGQMCPASSFLSDLNETDDTWGDVSYTTILNRQGGRDGGRLRGGATEVTVDRPHRELLTEAAVQAAVLAALSN